VARETGRKLVVPLRTACLLEGLSDDPHLADAGELWADQEHLRIHFHRAGSGAYIEQDYARTFPCRANRRLSGAERPCRPRKLEAAEIGRQQEEFIWVLDFWHFTELTEARPREGSLLIYSMSEFLEDPIDILRDEILQNWCARYHLHKEQVHASGHASGPELRQLVEEIGPEVLTPSIPSTQNCSPIGVRSCSCRKKGSRFCWGDRLEDDGSFLPNRMQDRFQISQFHLFQFRFAP
jgi:ribonuclease J